MEASYQPGCGGFLPAWLWRPGYGGFLPAWLRRLFCQPGYGGFLPACRQLCVRASALTHAEPVWQANVQTWAGEPCWLQGLQQEGVQEAAVSTH
eukprot:351943-Chlamydomonas_euryale.AAC.8